MAYQSCITEVANNIAMDCAHPMVAGYTGRGVLVPYSINPSITQDATNPRIVSAITIGSTDHVIVVDNVMASPFDGSSKQSNAENGRPSATKTFVMRVPMRGAKASKEVIEPLLNSAQGYLLVAEKLDKSGKGSFEVTGLLQPLKATADGTSQSESENGGDTVVTLSCNEAWWECELLVLGSTQTPVTTDYLASKAAFDALIAKGF